MALQTLILKLGGITAGDYLTWCRDPEPPALQFALRSVSIEAEPLGDTITAVLDWSHYPPPAALASSAAGLPLSAGVTIDARGSGIDTESRLPRRAGVEDQLRTAA